MSKHFISLITVLALISVSGCATTNNISLEKKEPNAGFMEQYQSNIANLKKYDLFIPILKNNTQIAPLPLSDRPN